MKHLNLLFLLLVFCSALYATPVSVDKARTVADNTYSHYSLKGLAPLTDILTYGKNGTATFYVFIYGEQGFVITSADDAVLPVLGYSVTDRFDKNNIPVNMASWLEDYNTHIGYVVSKNPDNSSTKIEWTKISSNVYNKSSQAVNPLVATSWDQSSPYNNLCPTGTYTGCVATAMAQIMKYWNYPTTGTGSHTYTHATYGVQSADFGATTYQWSSMLNSYGGSSTAAQKLAVATLMYHCGVSVDMDYGTSGSGAYSFNVPPALINYFNYSPSCELKYLASFTTANWIAMLKNELDASRPVYYSGSGSAGGHAFVCDGYNSSSQFHFNWGWSGSGNGYFTIGSLNPMGDDFNTDNQAVIRIHPITNAPVANFTADTHMPPVGGTVNFTDASTNNPTSWSWTFDGGTPSTSTDQNPVVVYNTLGNYQVTLTVTNADGSDTKTMPEYVKAGASPSAWIMQNTGFAAGYRGIEQIAIVNPYVVWATAYDGSNSSNYIREFTRTDNGGITWKSGTISFPGDTSYLVSNILPFSDSVCYAAMGPTGTNGGVIAKTIDAGLTWSTANSPNYSASWLNFVHFFNANDGVCMGDPASSDYVIYTTSDGGNTWTQVAASTLPNCTSSETGITNMYDAYGDRFIWFGTTKGRIYRSTDKGLTWAVSATGLGTSTIVTPRFKDELNGIVTGVNSSTSAYVGMKKTTDGGATWTTVTPTGYYVKRPFIDFVPGTPSMWVDVSSGPGHGSSYSLNDCASFLNIDTGAVDVSSGYSIQYTAVSFYDNQTGWAGGFGDSTGTVGGIWKWDPSMLTSVPAIRADITPRISVYPNPAKESVTVEFNQMIPSTAELKLTDVLGNLITVKSLAKGTVSTSLNLSGQAPGVYMLTVNYGNNRMTKRILKNE